MGQQSPTAEALLQSAPYDKISAARPPIPVKTSSFPEPTDLPPPIQVSEPHASNTQAFNLSDTNRPPSDTATAPTNLNPTAKENPVASKNAGNTEDFTRDWFRETGSSPRGSQTSLTTEERAASSLTSAPSVPQILVESEANPSANVTKPSGKKWLPIKSSKSDTKSQPNTAFEGLSLNIPTGDLSEDIGTNNMKFSNRGSMLIDGKKINGQSPTATTPTRNKMTMPSITEPKSDSPEPAAVRKRAVTAVADRLSSRIMSTDDQALSEKVRSFYYVGSDSTWDPNTQSPTIANRMNLRWQDAAVRDNDSRLSPSRATSNTDVSSSARSSTIPREENELAGGLEDWQDVDNADVDRYGFIIPRSPTQTAQSSATGGIKRTPTTSGPGLQRVSTALQLASDAPRRRHTIRRSPSNAQRTNTDNSSLGRTVSNQSMQRPTSSKSLNLPRQSAARSFANMFPHNRDRRVMDEAGDMLTLPRSSTTSTLTRTLTEEGTNTTAGTYIPTATPQSRRKENEREDKWRKMAHVVRPKQGAVGGGMTFTFDISNPKLVERTWKGIPDTWRATAWHAFLSSSAAKYNKRHPDKPCLSDEQLTTMFHEYQQHNGPDDVQIDIDVPRTISSHIMFRRRYRGGQRLLFRVLHAMSMHFAETGYVQGMAALAATLLAYYEEERTFVMLVRLWELRGLEKLYKQGFGGLMEALDEFEANWLGQGELRKKLDGLMIGPTAYGTKWYLTLFNYSIPFPAQLRVWDVFLLLGDDDDHHLARPATAKNKTNDNTANTADTTPAAQGEKNATEEKANFGSTLDVLHATSAALIDGMRDILMESDFENAMKVLTSWVPIRDEDVFMRVAKAEWKVHRKAVGKSA